MAELIFTEPLNGESKLTDESVTKVQSALRKLKNACPSCGERTFSVSDRIYSMAMLEKGRRASFQQVLPVVVVNCGTCGLVMTFNARTLGLYQEVVQEKADV